MYIEINLTALREAMQTLGPESIQEENSHLVVKWGEHLLEERNKVIKEIAAGTSEYTDPALHLAFFGVTMFRLIDLVEKPDGDRTFLEDGIIEALLQPLINMLADNFEGTGITVERGGHMEQLYRKMYSS